MKGQTAVEYLMTYGWAILIILIVAGVLAYYGFFAPAGFLGESVTGFTKVAVLSPWSVSTGGNITLTVENRVGKEINITKIYAWSGTSGNVEDITDVNFAAGESKIIQTVTGISEVGGTAGNTFSIDVAIEYYTVDDPTIFFNSTGALKGTY